MCFALIFRCNGIEIQNSSSKGLDLDSPELDVGICGRSENVMALQQWKLWNNLPSWLILVLFKDSELDDAFCASKKG